MALLQFARSSSMRDAYLAYKSTINLQKLTVSVTQVNLLMLAFMLNWLLNMNQGRVQEFVKGARGGGHTINSPGTEIGVR